MFSFPRITTITQVFTAPQEFKDYVIINGLKCRPARETIAGGRVRVHWQVEVDGEWQSTGFAERP